MRAALVPLALASLLLLELCLAGPAPGEHERDDLYALHVRANRQADFGGFDAETRSRLLESADPLQRDFAMTWDLTRQTGSEQQRAHLEALGQHPDAEIGRFFLHHQVQSPDLAALRAYFTALARRRALAPEPMD